MKNVEYLVMMEAAENLYIVRKEYQEYIDARDVQGALDYKRNIWMKHTSAGTMQGMH